MNYRSFGKKLEIIRKRKRKAKRMRTFSSQTHKQSMLPSQIKLN